MLGWYRCVALPYLAFINTKHKTRGGVEIELDRPHQANAVPCERGLLSGKGQREAMEMKREKGEKREREGQEGLPFI